MMSERSWTFWSASKHEQRVERGNCQRKWKELSDLELSINHYVDDLWLKREKKRSPEGKKACRQKRETDRQTMMMHAENRNSRKEKRKGEREKLHNMTPWLNWINNWLRVKSGMTHPFSQCLNESSVAVLRTISLFLRLLLAYCNVRSAFEK